MNAAEDVICEDNFMANHDDHFRENKYDQTCYEIDDLFDRLFHEKIKRSIENDATCSKVNSDIEKLNNDAKLANERTHQHNINELFNQLLCHERLHLMHKQNKLQKCMLSACFFMTTEHRRNTLKYLCLFECD